MLSYPASARACTIVEILEIVLLQLSVKQIASRVCRHWQSVIQQSNCLRRALFLSSEGFASDETIYLNLILRNIAHTERAPHLDANWSFYPSIGVFHDSNNDIIKQLELRGN
ncbi:hypothetical protein BDW59DRAFT_149542 [Aspergillus cavernicola]|uniref:F-box domain-containing protein n=1 Tax=Aspergillus cavernicola TaxID=176166 RepID=A0ABR4I507_9EURO